MGKSGFHLNEEQRTALCACWKRPQDREIAALYLQEVERLIAYWQSIDATPIKQQIELAKNLQLNVEKNPALLERLPQDFEKLLATVWLRKKYGDAYFKLHEEACRKDRESTTARGLMAAAFVRAMAPNSSTSYPPAVSDASKLPPNYFQQTKTDADFLRIVASAAGEIEWMLRESKAWLEKPGEEHLLFLLAYSYEHHFGSLPSAANEGQQGYRSPFRNFLSELSKILTAQSDEFRDYKFGAVITRKVLIAITNSRKNIHKP